MNGIRCSMRHWNLPRGMVWVTHRCTHAQQSNSESTKDLKPSRRLHERPRRVRTSQTTSNSSTTNSILLFDLVFLSEVLFDVASIAECSKTFPRRNGQGQEPEHIIHEHIRKRFLGSWKWAWNFTTCHWYFQGSRTRKHFQGRVEMSILGPNWQLQDTRIPRSILGVSWLTFCWSGRR